MSGEFSGNGQTVPMSIHLANVELGVFFARIRQNLFLFPGCLVHDLYELVRTQGKLVAEAA